MLANIPLSSGNKSYAITNKKATFAVAFLFLVRDMNLILSCCYVSETCICPAWDGLFLGQSGGFRRGDERLKARGVLRFAGKAENGFGI